MKKWFKKVAMVLAITITMGSAVPALAATVYYNGVAVSWDYGRKLAVYSFSTVQTNVFTHSATANTTTSGWKAPGIKAHAEQFVGTGTATAYWNCK